MAVTIDWLVSSVVHWSHGGGHRGVEDGSVNGMVGHVGVSVEPDISGGGGQDSRQAEESLQEGRVFIFNLILPSQLSVVLLTELALLYLSLRSLLVAVTVTTVEGRLTFMFVMLCSVLTDAVSPPGQDIYTAHHDPPPSLHPRCLTFRAWSVVPL